MPRTTSRRVAALVLSAACVLLSGCGSARQGGGSGSLVRLPPRVVIGQSADVAAKDLGAESKRLQGADAAALCEGRCDEVRVYGGGTPESSSESVESVTHFIRDGKVRWVRWTFPGKTGSPDQFPKFRSFFPNGLLPNALYQTSASSPVQQYGVSDFFVRDLLWMSDGTVWTAMVLCPILKPNPQQKARASTRAEYRLVQATAGKRPTRGGLLLPRPGWTRAMVVEVLGQPDEILAGDSATKECGSECDEILVFGPAHLAFSELSLGTVRVQMTKARVNLATLTCDGSIDKPETFLFVNEVFERGVREAGIRAGNVREQETPVPGTKDYRWQDGDGTWIARILHPTVVAFDKASGRLVRRTGDPRDARLVAVTVRSRGETLPDSAPNPPELARFQPKPIETPEPVFPAGHRNPVGESTVGIVRVDLVVDELGRVADLVLVDGSAAFTESTAETVARWRFEPFVWNGAPMPCRVRYTYQFNIRDR